MQVDANVDEADVGRIQVGQRATFTVDSFPTQTFPGEVNQIRKAPQIVQNVVTYDVVIYVRNSEQKLAALAQAQFDLDRTSIRAPVNGVVVSRNVDVGQTVAASLQAPVLFTIAEDLSRMQVDANVDEADVGRIQVGQRATFTVDSFPTQTFPGEVNQIRKAPQIVQNVVTYDVVIYVRNSEQKL
ncbi:MAG: hypothetical protein DMD82_13050, partial [Candidatus Rokuibacteriota bacterium]